MNWIYHSNSWSGIEFLGISTFPLLGMVPIILWVLVWKGWALWLAARRGEIIWFIVLLTVNTFGLLEIFYIFAIAKQQDKKYKAITETQNNKDHKE